MSDVKVNVANAAQAVPEAARTAAAPQQRVVATTLAPGVVLMGRRLAQQASPSSSRTS